MSQFYCFVLQAVDISDRDKSISHTGLRSGDTIQFVFQLTEKEKEERPEEKEEEEGRNKRLKTEQTPRPTSSLQRKVVPADNSCLFTAINYCMSGSLSSSEHSAFMR